MYLKALLRFVRMLSLLLPIISAFTILLPAVDTRADDIYTVVVKRQEEKRSSRWTLSDWLETRDRMRLMDLWLALHSSIPYEASLGGNYQFAQSPLKGNFNPWEVHGAFFASLVGLEARYEVNQDTRWHAILNLRIFGLHDQSTNITLQTGIRSRGDGANSFRNALVGASISFYLARGLGLEGLYRYYFPSTPVNNGVPATGTRLVGGGFVEFRFFRIYADYFDESDTQGPSNGGILGTKFYF